MMRDEQRNVASLLRTVTLVLIIGAAVSSRLFAVVRYESIIHEFDPWFNFRATKVLTEDGYYRFWNWFDPSAWYPLGRAAGGTVYPGLMITTGTLYNILHFFNIPVNIRDVCVMLAPLFSGFTVIAAYLFTKTMKDECAALLAAIFIGIAPGYISRSVAGSYDNEAIAIFLLLFTFYLWIRAIKDGSVAYGVLTALFYFYMVAAWGGYVFITNMIPLHVFVLLLMGRYSGKIYVAYSTFYAIGVLASMQIPFVGFQPLRTSEHMAALGVFGLLQLIALVELCRRYVNSSEFRKVMTTFVICVALLSFVALVGLTYAGFVAPWTGRFYSLWDTGYAKKHIPIIASVSEHQPPTWTAYFTDLHFLILLFPVGIFYLFRELRDEHVFVVIYAVAGSYFSGVMVRLMLTLTPCVCVSAAIALSTILDTYLGPSDTFSDTPNDTPNDTPVQKRKAKPTLERPRPRIAGLDIRVFVVGSIMLMLQLFVLHCTYITSFTYSSPSVVLASQRSDGSQLIIDDFREAYYWLHENTAEDAKVMSWWDYGYQIAGFANRTTLVDNNTWNNTHIATVGRAMSTTEEKAYPILRKHDVDYILVVFGGLIGYSGDDINKFLWMIRISEGIWPEEINESKFFTPRGEYRIDDGATETMRESLMYKMSYYRFNEVFQGGTSMDRARGTAGPSRSPTLDTIEEVYTSENWLVRIYRVKKEDALGRTHKDANAFEHGRRRKKPAFSTHGSAVVN
ncbi:dolichyl-diphosphooligosaccharide--protein glycotransferase [Malassezia vespertilionis]|uniref:Dolichyl-diphosphooligosaccharide--protein glycosyltransferase subunit STT3 n=1 Tax=Malassezia vespertilionis TaxID=2020962 RepID=A0A2N1JEY8_9BASI|nr:dolichyl-diphosphooligosaccharide--protein glycotransferase [Malassezia vespertilionis]PKI85100.1 Stt3p [Malassezia vespertilionis]WFD06098.1 dolichyl-diphosphooligosaccharide--protein glycotransferase [Malassezia vespertilionis]